MTKIEFNKILIISDNEELSLFARDVFSEFDEDVEVEFAYSINNRDPVKMIKLGAYVIDLKNGETIEHIINKFNLVISLHCKQIFPKMLVSNVMCINFHPGFNPYNRGWFPQAFSIVNGFPAGASIHVIDEFIDHGLIIDQDVVNICIEDTSYEAYRKIIEKEKKLMIKNMTSIVRNSFNCIAPNCEGNYNSFDDFKEMCKLNLSSVGTLEEHINLLRATTHKGFRNAYFIDSTHNKYYVEIKITKEEK